MMKIRAVLCSLLLAAAATPAKPSEAEFLKTLAGHWSGKGTVITRIGRPAINVNCRLVSTAGETTVAMEGTCRGLLVVRRAISAKLQERSGRYSGVYIGPSGRPSNLSGTRKGDSINLAVRWSRMVNGDRSAQMVIQRVGEDGLRLRTVDRDLSTGRSIATSDILLRRI